MHCSNPSHPILMYAGAVALIFANMADAAFAKKQSWEAIGVKTMNNSNAVSFTRTLRLKVKAEAYPWLNLAAIEVNRHSDFCFA